MIHRLSIKNYRSIREVDLDLRVPKNVPDLPRFRRSHSRPDTRLPTVVAIVGANGAGKSNLLLALHAALRFVIHSFDAPVGGGIPGFQPFWSDLDISQPTRIEIEFDAIWVDGVPALYRYVLELNNSREIGTAQTVRYESLSYYPSKAKKRNVARRIFERTEQSIDYVGPELAIPKSDTRLKSIRPNASLISTLSKLNVELPMRIATDLSHTQMFSSHLLSAQLSTNTTHMLNHYIQAPLRLARLNDEIARFDIGIEKIEILPGSGGPYAIFHHPGLLHPIPLHEESAGTQHLLKIFPQLDFTLDTGRVCVIDEFDSFFHPLIVTEIFRWFQDSKRNPLGAQLFVTLHNSTVIDELEKPELLLAEKINNETTIFRAQDIEGLRREKSLLTKYRSGALGALPRIG